MTGSAKKIPSFLEHHETLSSTNDRAWEIIAKEGKMADRGVVVADFQEKGRGRAGRKWFAEKSGSLLVSVICMPPGSGEIQLLPLATGLGAIKAIFSCAGTEARLKWPNDIVVEGKKMGGILVETRSSGGEVTGAVIGIGLNLRGNAADFPEEIRASATTLEMSSGKACERDQVLAALFEQLNYYLDLCFSSPGELAGELSGLWAHRPGDTMKVSFRGQTIEGVFGGVNASGELVLATSSGETRLIQGEILENGDDA